MTDLESQNMYREQRNRRADMYYNLVPQFKPPSKFEVMKQNLRRYLQEHAEKKTLYWIGVIQLGFIFVVITGICWMIWGQWEFAWRLTLTGLVGMFLFAGIYSLTERKLNDVLDDFMKNEVNDEWTALNTNSKFQQKLKKLQEERELNRKGIVSGPVK